MAGKITTGVKEEEIYSPAPVASLDTKSQWRETSPFDTHNQGSSGTNVLVFGRYADI